MFEHAPQPAAPARRCGRYIRVSAGKGAATLQKIHPHDAAFAAFLMERGGEEGRRRTRWNPPPPQALHTLHPPPPRHPRCHPHSPHIPSCSSL